MALQYSVLDIITLALYQLNAIPSGDKPDPQDAMDVMHMLNNMLASWSTQRLFSNWKIFTSFGLQAGKNGYSMGESGTFGVRPLAIESCIFSNINGEDFPLDPLTSQQWAAKRDKNARARVPQEYYYAPRYAPDDVSYLFVWPVPSQNGCVVGLYYWTILPQFQSLQDTFDFPPGYERAVIAGLAIECAPMWERPVTPDLRQNFEEAKAYIQTLNLPPIPGAAQESAAQKQAAVLGGAPAK